MFILNNRNVLYTVYIYLSIKCEISKQTIFFTSVPFSVELIVVVVIVVS